MHWELTFKLNYKRWTTGPHPLLPISCHLPLAVSDSTAQTRPASNYLWEWFSKKCTDPEISCYTSVTGSNSAHGLPRSEADLLGYSHTSSCWFPGCKKKSVLVYGLFSKPFELMLLLCLTLGSCVVHGLHRARNAFVCNVTICLTCFPGLIKKHNKSVMNRQHFVCIFIRRWMYTIEYQNMLTYSM